MNNFSVKKKVLTGILAASMIITVGVTAFAANNAPSAGKAAVTGKGFNDKSFKDKKAGHRFGDFTNSSMLKTKLDELVKASTITQEQADKITAYLSQFETEKKAEMDKVKDMTEEERKAFFEQNIKTKTDIFAKLVSDGIITQEQADAINKFKVGPRNNGDKIAIPNMHSNFKTQLDSLVTAGTISQDEEDKIIVYMDQKAADMKAEMEKVKAMTAEERKAYMTSKIKEKTDMFAELVSQGILTQEKADAIKKTIPSFNHKQTKAPKSNNKGARIDRPQKNTTDTTIN